MDPDPNRRLVPKPQWVTQFEARLGRCIPVHPNVISALKFLVILPLILMALRQTGALPNRPWFVLSLFAVFALLDYLDGVVARNRDLETWFGRVFDRVTDYPMIFVVSLFCLDVLPWQLVALKLGLDVLLFVLFLLGRGTTENRLRTAISYSTLMALLLLSQQWAPRFVTPDLVQALLWLNVAFSSLVALNNLGVLQKRFIADALSGTNLACGGLSIAFAARGRPDVSLLFLLLGAACDGLDGAAARRFGGTRWGVYSDDVADAVNYGIAPGAALVMLLGGAEGWLLGIVYILFTLSRLVYFTLRKGDADERYFTGIPSTSGGMIVMSALVLFPDSPLFVGFLVGVAVVQMVSFSTPYRHVGRALADERGYLWGASALALMLVGGTLLAGREAAVSLLLAGNLVYGFGPTFVRFVEAVGARASRRRRNRGQLGVL